MTDGEPAVVAPARTGRGRLIQIVLAALLVLAFVGLALYVHGHQGSGEGFTMPGVEDFTFATGMFGVPWLNKPMMQLIIAFLLVVIVWIVAARRLKVRPTKVQFFFEFVYDFIRNNIARDMIGPGYQRFVPLLVSMFSLVIISNWFGELFLLMFPTFSNAGYTYGMVLFVYLLYIVAGFVAHGPGYLKQALIPRGVPVYMIPIIMPIEFLSTFITRPLTLSIRLIANMFAGHLVILIFVIGGSYLLTYSGNAFYNASGALSLVMSMVMMALEVFIGFLQAYVFTMLSASYISSSVQEGH